MYQENLQVKCPLSQIDNYSKSISKYIRTHLKHVYGNKKPLRVFHAKSIGLVSAEIVVDYEARDPKDPGFNPDDLKVGIFKEAKTYQAWIRFSNGDSTPKADSKKAVHGMAIKILNVESDEYLDEDPAGKTQDLVLLSSRNFVPAASDLQLSGVKVIIGGPYERILNLLRIFSRTTQGVITFLKGQKFVANILEESYFSTTPFAFGDRAIKWIVQPLKTITSVLPENPEFNFLRDRLKYDLSKKAKEDVTFELLVQFQEDERSEPIEDSSIVWKTKPRRVAIIKIPIQDFNTPERKLMDENMSFSPGHAVIEHRPLGSVNQIRRKVYQQLGKERREHGKHNV